MLQSADGGPWGGTHIDQDFFGMIKEITGPERFELKVKENREEFMDFQRAWEIKKRISTDGDQSVCTTTLPAAFLPENRGEEIATSKGVCRIRGNKLRMPMDTLNNLYAVTTNKITQHLIEISKKDCFLENDTIFMVGGLSSSPYVQNAVQEIFPEKTIVVPDDPLMAVLRGAVIYGFRPEIVEKRISRQHYGVEENGEFKVMVKKGEEITIGERIAELHTKQISREDGFHINIYSSFAMKAPELTTDGMCDKIGEIYIRMSGKYGSVERELVLSVLFDHTEMKIQAVDAKTQRVFMTNCSFIG